MSYPDPADLPLAVVETKDSLLLFVQSRESVAPAFWPVEPTGQGRYRCPCEGYRRRGACTHTKAAWTHRPLLAPVAESDPAAGSAEWWDRQEAGFYTTGGAS